MTPFAVLVAAVLTGLGSVNGLAIRPIADQTEVLISVEGTVSVRDYLLQQPTRLVLDISSATHALPQERFMDLNRGGVLSIRASQFQPEVVRVVLDLAQAVQYTVAQNGGAIRVSFQNPAGPFEAWSVGSRAVAAPGLDPMAVDAALADFVQPPAPQTLTQALQDPEQPEITVSFRDTPILDVLATFAEFSGRSIVAGSQVQGAITADIRDQPWDIALDAILTSYGLTAREMQSGIILVESLTALSQRKTEEEQLTQAFPIRYISVDSILTAIQPLIGEGGKVSKSPATNTLLVTAGRSTIERIQSLMGQLDVRTPQVTIAAKIIFVDRSRLEALGLTYDLKDSRGNQLNQVVPGFFDADGDGILEPNEQTNEDLVLLSGNSIAALGNANAQIASPSLRLLATLVLGRFSLITFLNALEDLRLSDIQAAPVITTMDHREAYVQVGERTPIRVIDASAGGAAAGAGAANVPRARVETEETGIILRVTPHVTGNQVLLELHAENSRPTLAASDIGFVFQTQESETQILLNDGETAVISGLTVIEKSEVRTGIPLLMDLPLIGALFRTTQTQETKRDLLIMVTPHIVREGEA